MPRRAKGPRLYLRERTGRPAVWVIRDGAGERVTGCGADDRGGAERALAHYLAEKHQPARPAAGARLSQIRITDVVNTYLREHAPHVANPQFLAATAEPVINWWADKSLADVRGATCRDYVTWRTQQPIRGRKSGALVGTQTARHDLKTLRAAIHHYHREYGPLDAVPVVTLPGKAAPKQRWLTWQESRRMLQASAGVEHLRRFVVLGLHTGTRSEALRGLRWMPSTGSGWIDVDAGLLYRRGGAQRETKKRQPTVRLDERTLRHLRAWRAADMALGITHVVHYAGAPITSKLRRSWDSMRRRAGLGPDVTPHTLRHTCTTWLLRSGRDPWTVAGFVGMSLEMLDRVYGHHSPKMQRRAGGDRKGRG